MITRILVVSGAAAVLALTACSSNSSKGGGGNSQPAVSNAPGGASSQSVTISANGSNLIAPDGHTLYVNTVDTASKISCSGGCENIWPPLAGTPKAGTGVDASTLSTITRPDGTTQAAFDGHPLYEFAADKAAGDKGGEGIADGGGKWHAATVTGTPASGPASVPDTGGASSSGTGYTY